MVPERENHLLYFKKPLFFFGLIFFSLYFLIACVVNTKGYYNINYSILPGVLFSAFILYFLAFQLFKNKSLAQSDLKLIFLFAILFSLTLLLAVPYTGTDFYHYFFEDVALVKYGQNPYFITPNDIPHEPISAVSFWKFLPSQHGPLRIYLTAPLAYLSGSGLVAGVFLYRLVFALFFLGAAWLIYKILAIYDKKEAIFGTLLFAWNPLIIYDTFLFGGTDIMMVFWLLAALYCVAKEKYLLSSFMLALAVMIKYVVVLFLPFLLIYCVSRSQTLKKKLWAGGKYLAIFSGTIVILFFPFWRGADLETLSGVLWVGSVFESNSFPGMVYIYLLLGGVNVSIKNLKIFFEGLFLVCYVGTLLWFYFRQQTFENLVKALFITMSFFLLFGKFWFFDKYLIWLLPLAFLLKKKWLLVGVFLSGMVVLGPYDPGVIIILASPPVLVFSFYYYIHGYLKQNS